MYPPPSGSSPSSIEGPFWDRTSLECQLVYFQLIYPVKHPVQKEQLACGKFRSLSRTNRVQLFNPVFPSGVQCLL